MIATTIQKLKDLVYFYGTDYDTNCSIELGNHELADENKTVEFISLDKANNQLTIDFFWFDKETATQPGYSGYPVENLEDDDIESLLELVEFAVADIKEAELNYD